MVSESVHSVLETLKAERERLDGAIASLQGLLGNGGGAGRRARRGRRRGPGRPPAARAAGRRGRKGGKGRKNAPRGLLKAKMHEALKRAGKPLGASKLRDAVIAAGYPARNPKTLYSAIFNAVKKDSTIKKTKDGFALK